jgi:hypothetical protein
MSSIAISSLVFACVFGSAVLGMFLRAALPKHHVGADSLDAVKMGMGLVATLSALVLGLLVASAKSSYDAQSCELTEVSSKIVLLDRVLAHYGPEATEVRDLLRSSVARALDQMWSKDRRSSSQLEPQSAGSEALFEKIQALSPKDEAQRSLKAPGIKYCDGHRTNALVDVRARSCLDIHAVARGAGFLAHGAFHQFRTLRPPSRDRGRQLVDLRALGFRCDFVDSGDVRTLCGTDSGFQSPASCRPRISRQVTGTGRNTVTFDDSHPPALRAVSPNL